MSQISNLYILLANWETLEAHTLVNGT